MFVGRNEELKLLKNITEDERSKLITVLGRRGNGKTTLVDYFLANSKIEAIKINGEKGVPSSMQSKLFLKKFVDVFGITKDEFNEALETKWHGVLDLLAEKINKRQQKLIVFIDEFPWLHTKKSYFVQAFASFWNKIQNGNNVYLILTGSAVAWMNKNVINTNGGLYARIHTIINLKPLSFLETVDFLYKKNRLFSLNEYLSYYLMTGGYQDI